MGEVIISSTCQQCLVYVLVDYLEAGAVVVVEASNQVFVPDGWNAVLFEDCEQVLEVLLPVSVDEMVDVW